MKTVRIEFEVSDVEIKDCREYWKGLFYSPRSYCRDVKFYENYQKDGRKRWYIRPDCPIHNPRIEVIEDDKSGKR